MDREDKDDSSSEMDPLQPFCEESSPEESHILLDKSSPPKPFNESNEKSHDGRGYKVGQSDPISIPASFPSECPISSSFKKVQFEVGGGDEDTFSLRGEKTPNMQSNGDGRKMDTLSVSPSNLTIPMLPAIAEESRNGSGKKATVIPYHKSTSMTETNKAIGGGFDLFQAKTEAYGFVQLDVLTTAKDLGAREWKETARWIKYEEDLEEGSGRWGKAHIASLSFYSMIKLRTLIEKDGIILLDLEERDMPGIAYRVVEELSTKGIIDNDDSPSMMRALLLRHKHVQDSSWFGMRRSTAASASVASLQSLYEERGRSRSLLPTTDPAVLVRRNSSINRNFYDMTVSNKSLHRSASGNYLKKGECIDMEACKPMNEAICPSEEDLKWVQRKEALMRRLLPQGDSEATMVMVGELELVKKPILIFIRLCDASFMFNVTEIPVPAKFFLILLTPPGLEMDIVEVGRAFGAMMSNRNFYEIAVSAQNKKNLLTGINEFLDSSIVLPPGDWDNQNLLPLHVLQAKSKEIRARKLKKQLSFIRSNESFTADSEKPTDELTFSVGKGKDEDDDPLKRTGRLFGGVINDLKRRMPKYKSDITDGFNFQCFSTMIFMYFASVGLVVTFAGLMGEKTNNLIALSETLTLVSVAGLFYVLFSAQPLIPLGPTGPLLVFDEVLFRFCETNDIEFLPARAWISFWCLLIAVVVAAFDGSVLVKWFSKFTQDVFACLTSLLLIMESVNNLIEVYENHPLSGKINDTRPISLTINTTHYSLMFEETTLPPILDESEDLRLQPNTALLSTILTLGTFFLAYFLKEFRNSVFLGEKARRTLGDFGVPIAILTMVLLDYSATDTYTQKIKVPTGFEPSNPEARGWLIDPMGIKKPFSMSFAAGAILPAFLLYILMFMSQQINELILNSKERKLKKGSGFHVDILIIAFVNVGCGLFGGPWLCSATLRSLSHLNALTVYSKNNPPGEKPSIVEVKEQRMTVFIVYILIGCSVLLSPLLAYTPMAVLFGVFLYMGVSSLSNTRFFERFRLIFIPVESHPQTPYVRQVKTWKIHMYTLIQIGCLIVLFAIKSWKAVSLAFPFFLVMLVPIRLQLNRFYTPAELEALDGG